MTIIIDSAWKKRLRPAEFRGVPFFIDSHEIEGGRHAVPHEAPDREKTNFTEDIGGKSDRFSITGHILGDNYFLVRDSLIAALKKKGSGILKHPYLGIKDVQVDGFRLREDTRDGRYASFQITFVETGNLIFPEAIFNAVANFFNEANEAIDAVQTAFESAWSITDLPGFAVQQAINTVSTVGQNIDDAVEAVTSFPDKLAELKKLTLKLKDVTLDLIKDPLGLSDLTIGAIEALAIVANSKSLTLNDVIDTSSGKDDQIAVYDPLLILGDDFVPVTNTPSQVAASNLSKAYLDMAKQAAILSVAKISVAKQFPSNQEAIAQQQKIIALIDAVLSSTGDDNLFSAFKSVGAGLIDALPNGNLGNLVEIKDIQMSNSIVKTYDFYESLANELDVIKRNGVRNPAFISPGTLEVLADG